MSSSNLFFFLVGGFYITYLYMDVTETISTECEDIHMHPSLLITDPSNDISYHFNERFSERVGSDSIDMFINTVNSGNIFIAETSLDRETNKQLIYCIYEDSFNNLYVAVYHSIRWATIMPIEYHINNIRNHSYYLNRFLEKVEQYNFVKELCY